MLFWFIAALLTFGASLAVLLPLSARRARIAPAGPDIEVYRDQLGEIDRDRTRGLIGDTEAEQARAEIGRRILKLASGETDRPAAGTRSRLAAMLAVIAVPLVSWGVYAAIGSPDLPSQPLQTRLEKNPADSSVDELVARAERHLAANPADGQGWDVLAPIYLRLGREAEAVTAYGNAIRLLGTSAAREAGLGEAMMAAAGGIVTSEAREAFERSLRAEPGSPKAEFYLAVALAQEGRIGEARARWEAMLAALPEDSPWQPAVAQAIAGSAGKQTADAGPAPSQDDMAAAEAMAPADRQAMIETMVASLDEKLRANPGDRDDWMRLIRSYVVLGRTDAARDALGRGVTALGKETQQAKDLAAFAASLGLAGTGVAE